MDLYAPGPPLIDRLVANAPTVLLLDASTSASISLLASQLDLLARGVYLVDLLDATRDAMVHVDCTCYVAPSPASVSALARELAAPKYRRYLVVFSAPVLKTDLERLAAADAREAVIHVLEAFSAYRALAGNVFATGPASGDLDPAPVPSPVAAAGLLATLLLLLRARPVVRYERNSRAAARIASEVEYATQRSDDTAPLLEEAPLRPLVLVLDRKNDPLTPLLLPWTYRLMIHEYVGIRNNTTVDATPAVLSPRDDVFYAEAATFDFGRLLERIGSYVAEYRARTATTSQLDSVADMKRFIDEYPEFKRMGSNVSKHVELALALDSATHNTRAWEVSEWEQTVVSGDSHDADVKQLETWLAEEQPLPAPVLLRAVLVYALRYELHAGNRLALLRSRLALRGVDLAVVDSALAKCGAALRLPATAPKPAPLLLPFTKKRETNAYMQHRPRVCDLVEQAVRGRLSTQDFVGSGERAQEIIVYFVGGGTYEEARAAVAAAGELPGVRVVVGADVWINTKQFVAWLGQDTSGDDAAPAPDRLVRQTQLADLLR